MVGESRGVGAGRVLRDPVLFLAFGFGSGLAPKAPGTFGTAAAVPVCWLLSLAGAGVYWGALAVFLLAGVWLCGKAAQRLGVHDHPGIVWDELVGYLITLAWVPFSWPAAMAGFVLFRLFDILKPWPIGVVDRRVEGGLGIMLDDVLAGIVAGIILTLLGI